jgi:F-type H+-transporting ATPase subunit alpha
LFAANEGYFDDVEKEQVGACESAMQAHLTSNFADLMDGINKTPKLTDEVTESLHAAIKDFKANGSF